MEPIVELSPVGKYLVGLQVGPKIDIIKAMITDLSDQSSIHATNLKDLRSSVGSYTPTVLQSSVEELGANNCVIEIKVSDVSLGFTISNETIKNLIYANQLKVERLPHYLKDVNSDSDLNKLFETRIVTAIAEQLYISNETPAKKLNNKYSRITESDWQKIISDQIFQGNLVEENGVISINLENLQKILPQDVFQRISSPKQAEFKQVKLPKVNTEKIIQDALLHISEIPEKVSHTKKAMITAIKEVTKNGLGYEIKDNLAEKILAAAIEKGLIHRTDTHMPNNKYWITPSNRD